MARKTSWQRIWSISGRAAIMAIAAQAALSAQAQPSPRLLDRAIPVGLRSLSGEPKRSLVARLLMSSGVSGGIVSSGPVTVTSGEENPLGGSIDEGLARVLGPLYEWRETGGLINIVPKSGTPPLLNTVVSFFQWDASGRGNAPLETVPEVARRMKELGYVAGGKQIVTLSKPPRIFGPPETAILITRRDISLLDLLNDMVKSYSLPSMWYYHEFSDGG